VIAAGRNDSGLPHLPYLPYLPHLSHLQYLPHANSLAVLRGVGVHGREPWVVDLLGLNTIVRDKVAAEDGIGLANVRERLAVQFEGRAGLAAAAADEEWCSEITVPAITEAPVREQWRAAPLVGP